MHQQGHWAIVAFGGTGRWPASVSDRLGRAPFLAPAGPVTFPDPPESNASPQDPIVSVHYHVWFSVKPEISDQAGLTIG